MAEEIWAGRRETSCRAAAHRPRGSRAGASAQAAYRRHQDQERECWRPGWVVRVWAVFGAASGAALLIGLTVGDWLALPMALLAAALTWWRLRFRPSAAASIWRRQAAMQRRTAGVLGPLGEEGYLILHDITLPGWLASLDHLVVGPTGVWVVESGPRRRRLAIGGSDGAPAATLRGLRGQAGAIAECWRRRRDSVRGVLCLQAGGRGSNGRSRTSTSRLLGNSRRRPPRIQGARARSSWPRPLLEVPDRRPDALPTPRSRRTAMTLASPSTQVRGSIFLPFATLIHVLLYPPVGGWRLEIPGRAPPKPRIHQGGWVDSRQPGRRPAATTAPIVQSHPGLGRHSRSRCWVHASRPVGGPIPERCSLVSARS